jgi:hypothetical protein
VKEEAKLSLSLILKQAIMHSNNEYTIFLRPEMKSVSIVTLNSKRQQPNRFRVGALAACTAMLAGAATVCGYYVFSIKQEGAIMLTQSLSAKAKQVVHAAVDGLNDESYSTGGLFKSPKEWNWLLPAQSTFTQIQSENGSFVSSEQVLDRLKQQHKKKTAEMVKQLLLQDMSYEMTRNCFENALDKVSTIL